MQGAAPPEENAMRAAGSAFMARYPQMPGAAPPQVEKPIRVARLDRGGYFLLVPLRDGLERRGLVQLDAETLAVESIAAVSGDQILSLLSPQEALAMAQAAFPQEHGWREPELGWRPCRESYSSLMPLWVVGHAEGQVYVGQDGRVFAQLSQGKGGG